MPLSANDLLIYDGAEWIAQQKAGLLSLDNLSDVVISSPANGQVLTYNGTNWVNQAGVAGPFGIGTTSPGYQLEVRGTASNSVPVTRVGDGTVRIDTWVGTGSPNAQFGTSTNHTLHLISNNVSRMVVHSGGNIGIGTSSPSSPFHLTKTFTETSGTLLGQFNTIRYDPAASSGATSAGSYLEALVPATNTQNFTGSLFSTVANVEHYGTGTLAKAYGIQGKVNNRSTSDPGGTITDAQAVYAVINNITNGTIANGYGLRVERPSNTAGGTVTNFYGAYIGRPNNTSGTFSTFYGVYLEAPPGSGGASTHYAIYVVGGDSYFGGNVGIGATSPGTRLDVVSGGTPDAVTGANMRLVNSASAGDNNLLSVQSGTTGTAGISFGDSGDGDRGSVKYQNASGDTGEYIAFSIDGEKMRLQQNGNVGIGSVSPSYRFVVAQDLNPSSNHNDGQLVVVGTTNASEGMAIGFDTSDNYGYIQAREVGVDTRTLNLNPSGGKVGVGTDDPNSALHVNGPIATDLRFVTNADSPYTVTASDSVIILDTTDGNITINLPSTNGTQGRVYTFKRITSTGTGTVTINPASGEYLDGSTSYGGLDDQWDWVTIVSNGAFTGGRWYKISLG